MRSRRLSIRPPRSRCRTVGSGLRSPARHSRASAGSCCDEPHQQDAQGPGQAPRVPARNGGARGGTVAAHACGARAHAGFRFLLANHGDVDALRRELGRVARLAVDTAPDSHRSRLPVLAGESLRAGRIVASGFRSRTSIGCRAARTGLAFFFRIGGFRGSAAAFAAALGKNQRGHAAAGDRVDDAAVSLQEGLAVDAGNTGFAMLLARIMVESNDIPTALLVLQRHAAPPDRNPDFHAFAGALYQRLDRHKEAIEQYQAALRLAPSAGVWWLGLGISLQAVGRPKDAQDAFTRAKSAGNLAPDVLSFVDQRLRQLQ